MYLAFSKIRYRAAGFSVLLFLLSVLSAIVSFVTDVTWVFIGSLVLVVLAAFFAGLATPSYRVEAGVCIAFLEGVAAFSGEWIQKLLGYPGDRLGASFSILLFWIYFLGLLIPCSVAASLSEYVRTTKESSKNQERAETGQSY
jgi:hypothetical protein